MTLSRFHLWGIYILFIFQTVTKHNCNDKVLRFILPKKFARDRPPFHMAVSNTNATGRDTVQQSEDHFRIFSEKEKKPLVLRETVF